MRRLLSQRSRSGIKPRQHRRSDATDTQGDSQIVKAEAEVPPPVPPLPRKNVGVFVASPEHPGMRLATALLNDGSYNVTFIVPEPFDVPAPPAARLVRIRADLPRIQLTHAVVGQQVLIAAPGFGHRDNEQRVIDAAHAAGVKEILVVECGIESSRTSHKSESIQVQSMRTAVKRLQSLQFPGLNWSIIAFGLPSVLDPKLPIEANTSVETVRLPLLARDMSTREMHRIAADTIVQALKTQPYLFNRTLRMFILDPDFDPASQGLAAVRTSQQSGPGPASTVIETY